ncbi:hypothetical protein SCLCIDRAFT_120755, partial [Scleroderma citrinum Foug A]
WTAQKVIRQQKRMEIQDDFQQQGIQSGSQAMIGEYQKMVGRLMKKITPEEMEEAEHIAREWNDTHPLLEVQAKVAEKKGWQFTREYAEHMWKQCGTRVLVMLTVRYLACSNDGNYRHDFNDDLGPGTAFPDWEGIEDKWSRYPLDVFRAGEVGDGEDADPRSRMKDKKKTQVTLSALDNGIPQLPTILDLHVPEKQDILQAFVTCHYHRNFQFAPPATNTSQKGLTCGKAKASMPWMSIAEDPQDYIKDKYLPYHHLSICPMGVGLKEPSKLSGTQVTQILEFWRGRQQRNLKDVFMFRRWKDEEGVLQKLVGDDVSGTSMASEKRKRQGK